MYTIFYYVCISQITNAHCNHHDQLQVLTYVRMYVLILDWNFMPEDRQCFAELVYTR